MDAFRTEATRGGGERSGTRREGPRWRLVRLGRPALNYTANARRRSGYHGHIYWITNIEIAGLNPRLRASEQTGYKWREWLERTYGANVPLLDAATPAAASPRVLGAGPDPSWR